MKQKVDAIFENGMLRPLTPLDLADQVRVILTVESGSDDTWLDKEVAAWASAEGDASIPLEEVRDRLAKLTCSLAETVIAERGDF